MLLKMKYNKFRNEWFRDLHVYILKHGSLCGYYFLVRCSLIRTIVAGLTCLTLGHRSNILVGKKLRMQVVRQVCWNYTF